MTWSDRIRRKWVMWTTDETRRPNYLKLTETYGNSWRKSFHIRSLKSFYLSISRTDSEKSFHVVVVAVVFDHKIYGLSKIFWLLYVLLSPVSLCACVEIFFKVIIQYVSFLMEASVSFFSFLWLLIALSRFVLCCVTDAGVVCSKNRRFDRRPAVCVRVSIYILGMFNGPTHSQKKSSSKIPFCVRVEMKTNFISSFFWV